MSESINKDVLKQILEQQKEKALESLKSCEESVRPVELDQTRQGRLSRMDALQQQAMSQATLHRLQLELKRIDATLRRLHNEDYGYCIKCGDEIEWERLKINPSLVVCRECMDEAKG
ncbi:TPA: TraR/DksA family transcriptional regulator [Legionella pneumophila]